jgi:hypothetical protein
MNDTNIDQTLDKFNQAIKDLIASANQPVSQEITQFLEFRSKKGDSNSGKGIIWSGDGTTKQIVFVGNPDRFFATENLDLNRDKNISIGGVKVLDVKSLGTTVEKSNLRELGILRGLLVEGSINVSQYLFFNSTSNRFSLGIDTPHSAFSVAEQGLEVMIGTNDQNHGMIGTYASNDFDIVTANIARITVDSNGNIDLGNFSKKPIKTRINGTLSVGVEIPDARVDLHVGGAIRFNNKLHLSASSPPTQGTYNIGDIVWNDNPKVGQGVGWICLRPGSPGIWYPFGEIKEQNK